MKLTEKIIRIGLVLLVLLSLYFSVSIWISSAKKEQPLKSDTQVAAVVNERSATDVFLPLRLIRIQNGKTEMNNSENLIANVQSEIKKSSFGSLSQVVQENEEQFEKFLTMENGVELIYEDSFLLKEYLSVYGIAIDTAELTNSDEVNFTCIQIDLNQNKIRFLDFNRKDVYEAAITVDADKIVTTLDKTGTEYNQISDQQVIGVQHYYFSENLKMKKYSYILASQPVTKFRNAFFANTDDIQTNEDSNDFSYTSGNERLVVDERLGKIHFNGVLETRKPEDNIYSDSFGYIKKLGTNMGNIRYFDRTNSQINYRTFVEGYPVFSENNKGQVHITIDNEKAENSTVVIDTSVDTIQVPIPSEEEVTLQSTESLFESLSANGADAAKISSVVIGYTWHKIEEITQVVDLTPEWYIRYDEKWYSERDLLEQLANSEVE